MLETHKSGYKKLQERLVSTLEYSKSQSGTGPGVRASKRHLLAFCTRCKCSMEIQIETSTKMYTPFLNLVQLGKKSNSVIRSTSVTMSKLV